jgi:hypothetical protein
MNKQPSLLMQFTHAPHFILSAAEKMASKAWLTWYMTQEWVS